MLKLGVNSASIVWGQAGPGKAAPTAYHSQLRMEARGLFEPDQLRGTTGKLWHSANAWILGAGKMGVDLKQWQLN